MNSSSGSHDEDEPLVSVAVTDTAGFAGHPIKGPGSGTMSVARWIQPGETVEIGDISIPGGFFYLGEVLRSHPKSVDACVVDARAHVSRGSARATQGLGSIELSYGSLTSEQRRTYLEWLGSERKKSDINTGYLFFHLYAFERRVLIDGAAGKVTDAEYRDMSQELRRLENIDVNYSWQKHVRNLLQTIDLMMGRATKMYEQTAPNGLPSGYQVPMNVRVAFGQAAVDKRPVPASWALAWVKLDPMMIRRAAVTRCPEEFDRVFMRKYGERFKNGMLLPVNRTLLDARPQPAFSALTNMPVPGFLIGLPDIAAITGPRNKLQWLLNESAAALDSYSRYLGRKPEAKGTLDAALRLPTELWPESTRQEIKSLAAEVEQGTRVTTFGQILLRFKSTGTLTRDNAAAFCVALGQAGIAVEPDVRLGARTPKLEDVVALFPATPSAAVSTVDDAYNVSTVMIDLAASIATADGAASEATISLIDRQIDAWSHLSTQQWARLKARNRVQLAHPGSAVGLKKKLAALSSNDQQAIAAFLVQTANADGGVSREKVKLLEKVYRMLDIDAQRLYTDLHQGAGGQSTQPAVQPRMIKHESSAVGGFVLDASRIQALKRETARV
ncbi:TerB N-terminal domain-containing protein, partial [Caballeronia sp.]|uniref:tellurite resistance TerB family protein n=1 Tax=Caballeronia sp. TaxID=1931223 RepID=UPI003C69F65F